MHEREWETARMRDRESDRKRKKTQQLISTQYRTILTKYVTFIVHCRHPSPARLLLLLVVICCCLSVSVCLIYVPGNTLLSFVNPKDTNRRYKMVGLRFSQQWVWWSSRIATFLPYKGNISRAAVVVVWQQYYRLWFTAINGHNLKVNLLPPYTFAYTQSASIYHFASVTYLTKWPKVVLPHFSLSHAIR